MYPDELSGPDLAGVVADADAAASTPGASRTTGRFAALSSIVGFKRLAGRPRDRNDLEELEALHGELPVDPIPGLDG
jgi:hypothetical protein